MSWFVIALVGTVLYAISNHVDKCILEKHFKVGEVGAVVLFSSLLSVIALPILYQIDSKVFSLSLETIILLLLNGTLNILCLIFYFKALRDNEASQVVPFYQLIPVFSFFLGYFILGEFLNLKQIAACVIIIIGAAILSIDFSGAKVAIKKKVVVLMVANSFLTAVTAVVFKLFAVKQGFLVSAFWDFAGNLFIGIVLFSFISSYRKSFLQVLNVNSGRVMSVIIINGLVYIAAEGITLYATMLAPVTLVMTANGLQPLFVLVIGIFMALAPTGTAKESLSKIALVQKTSAIGIITAGALML
jgi:uncharacterized membrane protein